MSAADDAQRALNQGHSVDLDDEATLALYYATRAQAFALIEIGNALRALRTVPDHAHDVGALDDRELPLAAYRLAADVADWIERALTDRDGFTRRDAHQQFKGRRDEEHLDAALAILLDRGLIDELDEPRDRRTRYFVIPERI